MRPNRLTVTVAATALAGLLSACSADSASGPLAADDEARFSGYSIGANRGDDSTESGTTSTLSPTDDPSTDGAQETTGSEGEGRSGYSIGAN